MLDPDTLATTTRRSLHAVGDLATSFAEVNYGLSPGDAGHPWPYLYVGPWTADRPGNPEFWTASFGAARPLSQAGDAPNAIIASGVGFLLEGYRRLV